MYLYNGRAVSLQRKSLLSYKNTEVDLLYIKVAAVVQIDIWNYCKYTEKFLTVWWADDGFQ